jgi:hypothetical protein
MWERRVSGEILEKFRTCAIEALALQDIDNRAVRPHIHILRKIFWIKPT